MKELKELQKDVQLAIDLVAAEYSYAKNIQNRLDEIEKKEPDAALKEIKVAFRILRWIGRAERKVDRSEQKIIRKMERLSGLLPAHLKGKEAKLLEQLKVAEAKLIKAASLFTGELREDLLRIKTDLQLLKKVKKDEKIRLDLQRLYQKSRMGASELIRWLSATETILRKIEEFDKSPEIMAS